MLIIEGTITVDPADRQAFLASRRLTMQKARAMKGCLDYVFSADGFDADTVRLFERWESDEDVEGWLEAHRTGPRDPDALDVPVKAMQFTRYVVGDSSPVVI